MKETMTQQNAPPEIWDHQDEIERRLEGKRAAVFLDYDGTLSPIVERPEQAVLSDEMREAIAALSRHCMVAVVSGRDRADVEQRVGLEQLYYAGSHGFDITGPDGMAMEHEEGRKALPELDKAERLLRENAGGIEGVNLERKRFSLAIHYRQVAEENVGDVEKAVDEAMQQCKGLRKKGGKKIFELQPDIDWDKGRALEWLLRELDLDKPDVVPIYLGDDLTDEDGFRAIADRGIGVVVELEDRGSAAHYSLRSVPEVRRFLIHLTDMIRLGESEAEWKLFYARWEPEKQKLREALTTLGNGYFATRGAAEESRAGDAHYPGTYLAGGYNRLETHIAGRTVENEDLVNWPNWLCLNFRHDDGDWFGLDEVELLDFHQELDLKQGLLLRSLRFRDKAGRETSLVSRRIVHMAHEHLAAQQWTLMPENWSGRIVVRTAIDADVINDGVARYRDLSRHHLETLRLEQVGEDGIAALVQTNQSNIRMAQAARTRVYADDLPLALERTTHLGENVIEQELTFECERHRPVRVEKIVAVYTSRDHAVCEPMLEAKKSAMDAGAFDELFASHRRAWRHLWNRCDIEFTGESRAELVLRVHIFHLLQTTSMNIIDRDVGVPSRGLHGEAYRGHIFWDEIYIFPFLNLRIPEVTRELLMYRHRRLPEARRNARQAGYAGAMYPWQSGSNGREETQELHLNPRSGRWIADNTHLQRHVNAAIAWNVWQYYQATDDREFMAFYGAEMMLEIARFWASLAAYNAERDRFEIHGVVGPDEYHTQYPDSEKPGLNNNAYTNVMAAWVMHCARHVLELLTEDRRREILDDLELTEDELLRWEEMARRMFIPFHGDGIISQFEGYEHLEDFDWEGYREKYGDIQRLDRILEAEGDTPNRYQVCKQADVLMLFYLFTAEELENLFYRLGYVFNPQTIPKNIDYYFSRTSHGSTLSRIVHSWVLARSDRPRAWQLFQNALESDVSDIQGGTTPEGIHLGAMAGTIDLVQRCFLGVETSEDRLWFNPCLPEELPDLSLRLRYRGNWFAVKLTRRYLRIASEKGWSHPAQIGFGGKLYAINHDETKTFELDKPCMGG